MRKIWLFIYFFSCWPLVAKESWNSYREGTILQMAPLTGWCSHEKARSMMDLIYKDRCTLCVEIGVFSGKSLFPIAKTLKYLGRGVVFAIDPWDSIEATKGMKFESSDYKWWDSLDFNYFYLQTANVIQHYQLKKYCELIKLSSEEALSLFSDASIDFLHIDGNHAGEIVFQDVVGYFPKVKKGGYILLNDPNWISAAKALVFLLERAELISPFLPSANYYIFRKNKKREAKANVLFKN